VQLAGAVGGHDDEWASLGLHGSQLGDGDLEVREELEQEGLELVVGAVDLVDQQDDRALVQQRLEQRPAQQEALGVERLLLASAQMQELARVVPVVESVVEVDALVALKPDQVGAGGPRERLSDLGLADAGLTFEQQRLLEGGRQIDGSGEAPIGEIALAGQGLPDGCGAVEEGQSPAASLSARPVSVRARCRL
jgi:hypothetical protein